MASKLAIAAVMMLGSILRSGFLYCQDRDDARLGGAFLLSSFATVSPVCDSNRVASVDFLRASMYRNAEVAEMKLSGGMRDARASLNVAFRMDSEPDALDDASSGQHYRFGRWFLREASLQWNSSYTHYFSIGKLLVDGGSFSAFFNPVTFLSDYSGYTEYYVDTQAFSPTDMLPSGVLAANYRLVLDSFVISAFLIPRRFREDVDPLDWYSVFQNDYDQTMIYVKGSCLAGSWEIRGSCLVGLPESAASRPGFKTGLGVAYSMDRSIVYAEAALKNYVIAPSVVKKSDEVTDPYTIPAVYEITANRDSATVYPFAAIGIRTNVGDDWTVNLEGYYNGSSLSRDEWSLLWEGVSYALDGRKYDDLTYSTGGVNLPRMFLIDSYSTIRSNDLGMLYGALNVKNSMFDRVDLMGNLKVSFVDFSAVFIGDAKYLFTDTCRITINFVWYDPWNMGERTEFGYHANKYLLKIGVNYAL